MNVWIMQEQLAFRVTATVAVIKQTITKQVKLEVPLLFEQSDLNMVVWIGRVASVVREYSLEMGVHNPPRYPQAGGCKTL